MAAVRIPLLAVDGGGTKCLAVLVDRSRQELGAGRSGSCNYQGIGEEAAVRELTQALSQALEDARARNRLAPLRGQDGAEPVEWEVECAVFGLAGLDTEHDRRVITGLVHRVLDQLHIRVRHLIIENDGFAALLGATGGKPGILVIAGTGSIAFGVNEAHETARAGGWGHRVGDEGSGYWIAKKAIIAVLKAADGRGEPTALTGLMLPYIGLARVDELFNWTYGPLYSVDKVGELSVLVSEAADQGDPVAQDILRGAGEELFQSVRAVSEQLQMRHKPFQMILQGGVLQNDDRVRKLVVERISQYASHVLFEEAHNDPIYGVIAKGLAYLEGQTGW